jgi:flagellar hook-length control protein FliK
MPANLAATVQAAPTGHAGKATLPPDAVAGLSATGSSKASLEAASAGAAAAASLAPPAKTLDTPDQSSQSVPQAAFTMPGTMPGTTAPAPAPGVAATAAPLIQPNAAGLAATVTAMHQAGQSGAVLRLDPPGLGNLSVHVALGQNGQVNVLFIPSTQAASTVLQNNLAGLGTALAQSGITLGQAQVGGQFNQNAGQGTY